MRNPYKQLMRESVSSLLLFFVSQIMMKDFASFVSERIAFWVKIEKRFCFLAKMFIRRVNLKSFSFFFSMFVEKYFK